MEVSETEIQEVSEETTAIITEDSDQITIMVDLETKEDSVIRIHNRDQIIITTLNNLNQDQVTEVSEITVEASTTLIAEVDLDPEVLQAAVVSDPAVEAVASEVADNKK